MSSRLAFASVLVALLVLAGCKLPQESQMDSPFDPGSSVYQNGSGGPTGVTATPSDSKILISWTGVSGASSYNVYWSTNPGVSPFDGTTDPAI